MKKKIPLQVLEIIEPYVNKNGISFDCIDPKGLLLKFIDRDANSDFYFIIETYKLDNDCNLLIDWKPASKLTIANNKLWVKAEQLDSYFKNWLKLLEGYEKVKTVFDDPILDSYIDEYLNEFEILDEDAEIKPFTTKQVLFLDSHLEEIQAKIDKFQTPENKIEIEIIKKNIEELRSNLTKKSKKWVIKQVSKIWAQITKQGTELLKEFLSESKKLAIHEAIKFFVGKGVELLS